MINLIELNYKDYIEINQMLNFPENYLEGSIKGFENIKAEGRITLDAEENYYAYIEVKGKIYVLDSNTLEKIPMDISLIIDDVIDNSCINDKNMLDLVELLWQNIVLEVPIRYTKSDAKKMEGENWQIVDEEKSDDIDPRMEKLLDLYKGGE